MSYNAIVIGVSAGGMNALKLMFSLLPKSFVTPIIIVQHISAHSDSEWIRLLKEKSNIKIKEADEKEKIENATVYIAPPNYHLLIEKDKTFSLTIDERVNFARPSIDVLFESAADAYKNELIGIVLSGSNQDGTKGMMRIKEHNGLTIVQNPDTAEYSAMPSSVISKIQVNHILALEDIIKLLIKIDKQKH